MSLPIFLPSNYSKLGDCRTLIVELYLRHGFRRYGPFSILMISSISFLINGDIRCYFRVAVQKKAPVPSDVTDTAI